jgi:ribosomal-protein-alanine N-acetyltransferase
MILWSVSPASVADWEAIVAIEAASFGAASWGARSLREGLAAPLVSAIVARAPGAGQPDAYALWRTLGEEAEILSIGVRPDMRRRGAARALMRAALEDARAEGLRAMFLEVDAANAAALALYRKIGFYPVGRRRGYYRNGHDAVVLRFDL